MASPERGPPARARNGDEAETARLAVAGEERFDLRGDLVCLCHAPDARFTLLCHLTRIGSDEGHSVGLELAHVALRRLVAPHGGVHCRRRQDGRARGEQNRARKVVRLPLRHAREQIRRCRRDHHQIRFPRQADVTDLALTLEIEEIGRHALVADRPHRERSDELLRRLGHDTAHTDPALGEAPDEIEAFVGGDAAADHQKDTFHGHFMWG